MRPRQMLREAAAATNHAPTPEKVSQGNAQSLYTEALALGDVFSPLAFSNTAHRYGHLCKKLCATLIPGALLLPHNQQHVHEDAQEHTACCRRYTLIMPSWGEKQLQTMGAFLSYKGPRLQRHHC